jgi:pantothenate kinase-related protein Tda10
MIARISDWILSISNSAPMIIGIQGIQGSGKTTLCQNLKDLFSKHGKSCHSVSIDDFYKKYDDLKLLSKLYSDDSRFQGRGTPGTHDIDILLNGLHDLKNGKNIEMPIFDKTLRNGLGDRTNRVNHISASTDIVLVEGWCIGFRPIFNNDIVDLNIIEYAKMHPYFDGIIIFNEDYNLAYARREAAEIEQNNGLTKKQVKNMVDRFMPSYITYIPQMIKYWSDKETALIFNNRCY